MVKTFEDFSSETLYGIYNEDDLLVAVHKTEEGANENLKNWEKGEDDSYYVDIVLILP